MDCGGIDHQEFSMKLIATITMSIVVIVVALGAILVAILVVIVVALAVETRFANSILGEFLDKITGVQRVIENRGSTTQIGDAKNFITSTPIVYRVMQTKNTIIVPKGFVTDLASIPPPLSFLFPRDGVYMIPAIIHDYLYWTQGCTRSQADNIFFLAMKEHGVYVSTRWGLYLGVHWLGWWAWRTDSKLKNEGQTRFVSSEFVEEFLHSPTSAKESLGSVLANAKLKGGLVFHENSNPKLRDACIAAKQF